MRAVGSAAEQWYYEPAGETAENLALMRRSTSSTWRLRFTAAASWRIVLGVNRKRVQRLMRLMGLEAIYPKRRTTRPAAGHKIYPYLLRNVAITRPDQVWSSDITYVPLRHGFLYLAAVMDWYSRYVLAWRLSNTLEGTFLPGGAGGGAGRARPEIFNTDQGFAVHGVGVHEAAWKRRAWRSAWTAAAGRWTTCSSSGCGGA